MRLWRIASASHSLDRTGKAAAQHGGRWNPSGWPALYTSISPSLSALETFVHLYTAPLPALNLVAVDLPDKVSLLQPGFRDLPVGWNTVPGSSDAKKFGAAWLKRGKHLGLKVPSVLIPEESNVVLNPCHPDFARVTLTVQRAFTFDHRMFK